MAYREAADAALTLAIIVLAAQLKGTDREPLFWLALVLTAAVWSILEMPSRPATKEELKEMGFYIEDEIDPRHEKPRKVWAFIK